MRFVQRRLAVLLSLLASLLLFSPFELRADGSGQHHPGDAHSAQTKRPTLRATSESHAPLRFLKDKYKGWSMVESPNFRFYYHHQPHKLIQQIADVAESVRVRMARKWFGEVPDEWDPRCQVYMHADRKAYTLATKDGGQSEGCTLVRMEGLDVDSRRIHLHCDADNLLDEIVPHEVTHAVMGGQFGSHPTPRWADEGMAILSQPADSIAHYKRLLRIYNRRHNLFAIDVLMQTEDSKLQNTLEFYCQSVSLVDFLVAQHGPQVFTRFLWDSFRTDYEKSLKKHYGIASFAELEKRWHAYAFGPEKLPKGIADRPTAPSVRQ